MGTIRKWMVATEANKDRKGGRSLGSNMMKIKYILQVQILSVAHCAQFPIRRWKAILVNTPGCFTLKFFVPALLKFIIY
jgi:hypothetical protein